jgi:hypothetical protein
MLGEGYTEGEIVVSINIWGETENSLVWEFLACGIIARNNDEEGKVWLKVFDTIAEVKIVCSIEDGHLIINSQLNIIDDSNS